MALSAGILTSSRVQPRARRALLVPAVLVAFVALMLPMFVLAPAHLTSDESLYLAEAYNIAHGKAFTYPSGEPITHRAPLFPAMIAPAVRLGGSDAAYAVTKAVVALNVVLVFVLAWRLGGVAAGGAAALTAGASSFLNGFGPTLYLDPVQCSALLSALICSHAATRGSPVRWMALAGLCAGVAFLVKESAMQWAPLGVALWLAVPSLRTRQGAWGALAYMLAFAATAGWWPVWVYARTGEAFLLGDDLRTASIVTAACAFGVATFAAAIAASPRFDAALVRGLQRCAPLALVLLLAAWGAAMLYALTAHSTWGYPNDYATNIPRYLTRTAPEAQPYFLLVAAWGWCALAALRGDERYRTMIVAALLFAPFALFVANRGLQLRDALPLVYLSYIVLGLAAADAWRVVSARDDAPFAPIALTVVCVLGAVFVAQQTIDLRRDNAAASTDDVRVDSWENPFALEIAAWMDANLPDGARVLSSRLYFSSLHVRTGARFEIRQLPTVLVDITPGDELMLTPRSNLFRWGDRGLRAGDASDRWLYLKRYPVKGYWVGLSQDELLDYMRTHQTQYVVLTGDDVAFSSVVYAGYFDAHPAFTLLWHRRARPGDEAFVYAVDPAQLAPIDYPMAVTPSDLQRLVQQSEMSADAIGRRLGVPLRATDLERGLSDRELADATDGS
jgi:hypothetical protein